VVFCVQKGFIFYAFEGHINVVCGLYLAIGSPVGQPWTIVFECVLLELSPRAV